MPKTSLQPSGTRPPALSQIEPQGQEQPSLFWDLKAFCKTGWALVAAAWRDREQAGEGGSDHLRADLPFSMLNRLLFDGEMTPWNLGWKFTEILN